MKIIDFSDNHIESAMKIAIDNYEEEQRYVPILPKITAVPDLKHFAENRLGVAAFDDDRMLGFLCAYSPHEDVFGTTGVRGTFSPIHVHGVIASSELERKGSGSRYSKDRIYSLLYQEASRKWVKEGIRSHAIGLYTHDKEAVNCFFYNGFGLRCIDAVRSLDAALAPVEITGLHSPDVEYCEVDKEEWGKLLIFHNGLIEHLGAAPTFMKFKPMDEAELYRRTSEDTRYFAAKVQGSYIAYIKLSGEGENFATADQGMMNICGAYCNPIYRGSGIYHNLLSYLTLTLKKEGYQLLGVDCESFNPTARGFWLKHFQEYTHSLVRRIDDKAID
ncbi:MAG TPA: GNAT family N-acetyltransferase [Mobilitalea sp.]|nr:GNAT family N-acetyltransferase [Mobilitalea sp.]